MFRKSGTGVGWIADRMYAALSTLLALMFIAAVAMSFANAVGRYVWGTTFRGADELQVYIMVAITFVGAGIVAWQNRHLRLDVLIGVAPRRVRKLVGLAETALALVICGFMIKLSFAYVQRLYGFGMTSDTAGLPLWIPHSTLVIGFSLIGLAYILRLFKIYAPNEEQPPHS